MGKKLEKILNQNDLTKTDPLGSIPENRKTEMRFRFRMRMICKQLHVRAAILYARVGRYSPLAFHFGLPGGRE